MFKFEGSSKELKCNYQGYEIILHVASKTYDLFDTKMYNRKITVRKDNDTITVKNACIKLPVYQKNIIAQQAQHLTKFLKKSELALCCNKSCNIIEQDFIITVQDDILSNFTAYRTKNSVLITHHTKIIVLADDTQIDFLGFKIFKDKSKKICDNRYYKLYIPFTIDITLYVKFSNITEHNRIYNVRIRTTELKIIKDIIQHNKSYEIIQNYQEQIVRNKKN